MHHCSVDLTLLRYRNVTFASQWLDAALFESISGSTFSRSIHPNNVCKHRTPPTSAKSDECFELLGLDPHKLCNAVLSHGFWYKGVLTTLFSASRDVKSPALVTLQGFFFFFFSIQVFFWYYNLHHFSTSEWHNLVLSWWNICTACQLVGKRSSNRSMLSPYC